MAMASKVAPMSDQPVFREYSSHGNGGNSGRLLATTVPEEGDTQYQDERPQRPKWEAQPNVQLYRRCERLPSAYQCVRVDDTKSVRLDARDAGIRMLASENALSIGDKYTRHSCTRRRRTSWSAV